MNKKFQNLFCLEISFAKNMNRIYFTLKNISNSVYHKLKPLYQETFLKFYTPKEINKFITKYFFLLIKKNINFDNGAYI